MTIVLIALSLYAMTWIVLAITERRFGTATAVDAAMPVGSVAAPTAEMERKAA